MTNDSLQLQKVQNAFKEQLLKLLQINKMIFKKINKKMVYQMKRKKQ